MKPVLINVSAVSSHLQAEQQSKFESRVGKESLALRDPISIHILEQQKLLRLGQVGDEQEGFSAPLVTPNVGKPSVYSIVAMYSPYRKAAVDARPEDPSQKRPVVLPQSRSDLDKTPRRNIVMPMHPKDTAASKPRNHITDRFSREVRVAGPLCIGNGVKPRTGSYKARPKSTCVARAPLLLPTAPPVQPPVNRVVGKESPSFFESVRETATHVNLQRHTGTEPLLHEDLVQSAQSRLETILARRDLLLRESAEARVVTPPKQNQLTLAELKIAHEQLGGAQRARLRAVAKHKALSLSSLGEPLNYVPPLDTKALHEKKVSVVQRTIAACGGEGCSSQTNQPESDEFWQLIQRAAEKSREGCM